MANGQASIVFTGNTQQLAAALDAVGKKGKEAGDKAAKAHAGIGAEIKKAVPAIGTMTTAAGAFLVVSKKITDEWQKILQTQKEASDRLVQSSRSQARAIGLTDTPEQARRLQRLMDQLRVSTGRSGQEVGNFAFAAQSRADQLGELENVFGVFTELGKTEQAPDLASAVDKTADVMQQFNIEAKDLERTMGAIFFAAKASRSDFDQTAEALAETATSGRLAGATFEELSAIMSKTVGGSRSVVATSVRAVADEAAKRGHTTGIVSFVKQFEGMGGQELARNITNETARKGIQNILAALSAIEAVRPELESLNAVGARGLILSSQGAIASTRAGAGLAQARAEEAQRLAEEIQFGTAAGQRSISIVQSRNALLQQGQVGAALYGSAAANTANVFGSETLNTASSSAASVGSWLGALGILINGVGLIAANTAPKPPTANLGSQD